MIEADQSKSSVFTDEVRQKLDSLVSGLGDMGLTLDNQLTRDQIKDFLSNRKINGKEFNQELTNKLFEIINLNDENPTIIASDFLKGFVQLESDISNELNKFNDQYQKGKEEYKRLDNECKKYQQEKVNKEGLCENAKVTVIIEDVDIKSKIEGIQSISIKLIYNDEERETEFYSGSDNNQINQKFEFKPQSRNDRFEFVMEGINDNKERFMIGKKLFPLNTIDSQDEYEVQIIIPEKNDDTKPAAHINCKIDFYWSDLLFYDEERKKEEKRVNGLQRAVKKLKKYQDEINEIYHLNDLKPKITNLALPEEDFYMEKISNTDNDKNDKNDNLKGHSNNPNQNNFHYDDYYKNDDNNDNVAYKSERSFNNYTSKNTKFLCLGNSILGILSSFYRPDFPNELGGLLLFFGCFFINGFNNKQQVINYLKKMNYGVICLLVYDLVWIILNFSNFLNGTDKDTGGNENGVLRCAMILAIGNAILKGFLSMNFKKDIKNLEGDNIENNYQLNVNY